MVGFGGLKDRIYLFAGIAPGCEWVCARLSAYCQFDLPTREFRAVERHLNGCAGCAAEHKVNAQTLELLVRQMAKPGLLSPEAHVDRLFSRIRAQEKPQEALVPTSKWSLRRIPMSRFAVAAAIACVLMVVVPAMAYIGAAFGGFQSDKVFQQSPDAIVESQSASPESPKTADASTSGATTTPKTKLAELQGPGLDADTTVQLTKIANESAARAEVEAMLPHTDAEYEAWARKEYPHIMALYDILTGKPTKAWPSLPEDVQALLTQYAEMAKAQEKLLWDGIPVNIPDWGVRLYASTPESERPTGWRALVIYSGEIFKIDWPKTTEDPNVLPTLDGLRNAALVAGHSDQPDVIFRDIPHLETPNWYPEVVASSNALTIDVLTYIATSSGVITTAGFRKLTTTATDTLATMYQTTNSECAVHTRLQLLSAFFDSRKKLFSIIARN